MLRVADFIDDFNTNISIIISRLALSMVQVKFLIVVGRYVFRVNSIAAQESVFYMHATQFMLAAGFTLLVDKHVRVDVFYAKATPKRYFRTRLLVDTLDDSPVLLVVAAGSQFLENS